MEKTGVEKTGGEKTGGKVLVTDSKKAYHTIGHTLADQSLPQNYETTFLEMKQKGKQKTIHVKDTIKESYNKPFSKEELTRAI